LRAASALSGRGCVLARLAQGSVRPVHACLVWLVRSQDIYNPSHAMALTSGLCDAMYVANAAAAGRQNQYRVHFVVHSRSVAPPTLGSMCAAVQAVEVARDARVGYMSELDILARQVYKHEARSVDLRLPGSVDAVTERPAGEDGFLTHATNPISGSSRFGVPHGGEDQYAGFARWDATLDQR